MLLITSDRDLGACSGPHPTSILVSSSSSLPSLFPFSLWIVLVLPTSEIVGCSCLLKTCNCHWQWQCLLLHPFFRSCPLCFAPTLLATALPLLLLCSCLPSPTKSVTSAYAIKLFALASIALSAFPWLLPKLQFLAPDPFSSRLPSTFKFVHRLTMIKWECCGTIPRKISFAITQ